ncbi:hypothetical protein DL93DRAFT_1110741 [Clavulina sp. PMI_390]|nr:hypothetical protein DL93DRAFT_1110741 [Clavulina sp. PMI_390]
MVRMIVQKAECDLPVPEEIINMFPYYISENHRVLESFFAKCLPFHDRLLPNKTPEAMLDLAVSVFCSNHPSDKPSASERHANLPFHVVVRRQYALPYAEGNIDAAALDDWWSFDFVASKIICTIIRFIGLDADNCTHEQLEAADCFVSCLLCRDGRSYAAMHWEQAIHHWHTHHSQCAPEEAAWGVLTEKERGTVLLPWASQCEHKGDLVSPDDETILENVPYDCALCPTAPTFRSFAGFSEALLEHLQDRCASEFSISPGSCT